jgi:putative nucleotidyltransferase with HDIG domain
VDDLHRPPTRFERLREWMEGLPTMRVYAGLTLVTWIALTALIGLGSSEPIERNVPEGIIESGNFEQIESLLQDPNPWTVLLGVAMVVAIELGIAWYFLERFGRRILKTNTAVRIALAASLTVLFTALARLFIELDFNAYLTPLAGLSVIGTMLLGPRLMFLMVVITAVNVGVMKGNDFLLTASLLLSSGFAIYTVVRVDSRQRLLKAGLVIAAVTAVVTFAVGLIGGGTFPDAAKQGALGLGNGLLSLMLAMVLLPLLEDAFNILTPMKLLEFSNTSNTLIHKLLQKAPGTFTHSMQVGTLAENAAESKMEHPAYFIENQIGQINPHDALSPTLSAKVIRRHVKDGMEMGRAWGLPQELLDIIAQHHGSTRIEYFYRKAIEVDGDKVNEADFRYSGGLPKSKEAGIVMLADSVEATVKSLAKPTPKRIEDVVTDTINRKLDDGQFDECDLTMREIHEVGEAILEALVGFLGPRIEYPTDNVEARNGKTPNGKAPNGKSPNGKGVEKPEGSNRAKGETI